jgi:hypothetical protein
MKFQEIQKKLIFSIATYMSQTVEHIFVNEYE